MNTPLLEKVEHSIQVKYGKDIWSKFTKAVKTYELIKEGDKIACCMSGGKDSFLMALLFKKLHKYSDFPFSIKYLSMNPGYSEENAKLIEKNAEDLDIPIEIFKSEIFDTVYNIEKSPCYLCARMRRGHLYAYAKEMGCNKIALGHHFDDVIETTLMGMLYGAQIQSMLPKLHSTNFPGIELIRPMYLIREEDIIKWRDYNGLTFLKCACKFTANMEVDEETSKRKKTKELIKELHKTNPLVENSIFKSLENVQLDTLLGYKQNGIRHSFLDNYDN